MKTQSAFFGPISTEVVLEDEKFEINRTMISTSNFGKRCMTFSMLKKWKILIVQLKTVIFIVLPKEQIFKCSHAVLLLLSQLNHLNRMVQTDFGSKYGIMPKFKVEM